MSLALLLSALFTFVELNCENLFDTQCEDSLRDTEFLPTSVYHWTNGRYWRKLTRVSQALVACGSVNGEGLLPDMAVLTEVENDTVMRDLCRRSPLRTLRYEWVMTDGPDVRGINVALIYSPLSFRLLNHHSVRIPPPAGFRPTRDLLYCSGELMSGDTLHVVAVHAPSRTGGEPFSRPYRLRVADRIAAIVDSINRVSVHPLILIAGDFNDYSTSPSLQRLQAQGLTEVSSKAVGSNGAKATYRYHGEWGSLDHILCNALLAGYLRWCGIADFPFLLEKDKKYGGVKPHRTYLGPRYLGGTSDHLPLVAVFQKD